MGTMPFKLFHLRNPAVFTSFFFKTTKRFNHDSLTSISDFIKSKVPFQPVVLIICGSGLGDVCEKIKDPITLNYKEIPNFPVSTVEGHKGRFIFGTLSDVQIVCMQGRFHYYEGYSLQECTVPIRSLVLVGIKVLMVTNAAGGINAKYKAGDIMLIKDQINFLGLAGLHPLRGPNDSRFGPRFFPMNRAYDRSFIKIGKELAKELDLADHCHEGVYASVGGPNYESIAEINMLKTVGADAVGMSTAPEVLVASHSSIPVFGFSIISNIAISSYDDVTVPDHEEVLATTKSRTDKLTKFVTEMVANVAKQVGKR